MPTVRNTIKALISCAAVSLASTFITAALNTYGVIDVSAARWELFLAGLVILGAVTTSDFLCDKSWKHVLTVFALSVVLVGAGLFWLDDWAIRKKSEIESRTMPPLPRAVIKPPIPPAIAYMNPRKSSSPKNVVSDNQNVVGNTVTQGTGGISQIGNGNTLIVPQSKPAEDVPHGPVGILNREGAKATLVCSEINIPNGTAIDNRGELNGDHLNVNGTSPPCTPTQKKISAIDMLLDEPTKPSFKENALEERAWVRFAIVVLRDQFDEHIAGDFAAQSDTEKRIEFLKELRKSLHP